MRKTKYVTSPFLQSSDVCFAKAALESLSKTFLAVGLVQIDLLVLVARGVVVHLASYFIYPHLARRQQTEISFSCLNE